ARTCGTLTVQIHCGILILRLRLIFDLHLGRGMIRVSRAGRLGALVVAAPHAPELHLDYFDRTAVRLVELRTPRQRSKHGDSQEHRHGKPSPPAPARRLAGFGFVRRFGGDLWRAAQPEKRRADDSRSRRDQFFWRRWRLAEVEKARSITALVSSRGVFQPKSLLDVLGWRNGTEVLRGSCFIWSGRGRI